MKKLRMTVHKPYLPVFGLATTLATTLVSLFMTSLVSLPAMAADWYQVEVIVFSQRNPEFREEFWPEQTLNYPADMLSILPRSDNDIRPLTLGQVRSLERYFELLPEAFDESETAPPVQNTDDFLFKSRIDRRKTVSEQRPQYREELLTTRVVGTASGTRGGEAGVNGTAENAEPIDIASLFDNADPTPFRSLEQSQRLLNSVARSLRRSSRYDVVYHDSWLQMLVSGAPGTPVMLQAAPHYDHQYLLDGTVTIRRSRFLHVDTDLWYTEFMPRDPSAAAGMTAQGTTTLTPRLRSRYPEAAKWAASQNSFIPVKTHVMNETRRLRSTTLHYLDHPAFGLVIRIDPFEMPGEDTFLSNE